MKAEEESKCLENSGYNYIRIENLKIKQINP